MLQMEKTGVNNFYEKLTKKSDNIQIQCGRSKKSEAIANQNISLMR